MIKQRFKNWWPYILAFVAIIIAVVIWPYYFTIYVSPLAWYSVIPISVGCIASILKWG